MPSLSEPILLAFQDEMRKLADWRSLGAQLSRRALSSGAGAALGAAGGGLVGAGYGGAQAYGQARSSGATTGEALRQSLGSALRGARSGAAVGAGLGAVGGAASGQLGASLARQTAAMGGPVGTLSRFGQRQVHALTGAVPEGFASRSQAVRSIGAGGADLERRFSGAAHELARLRHMQSMGGQSAQALEGWQQQILKQKGQVDRLGNALGPMQDAEELGMTSVPGVLKSLVTKPGQGLRAGLGAGWSGASRGEKALMLGLPGASIASELQRTPQPGEPQSSKLERVGRIVGQAAPMALAPVAMAGDLVLSSAGERAGAALGAGASRLLSKRTPAPLPEEAPSGPVERMMSPAAAGRPPEGLGQ